MIRQDCKELNEKSKLPFKEYGCKLFTCFYFAEQILNRYYDVDNVITTTIQLIEAGYITKDLEVFEDIQGINKTKLVLRFLGLDVKNVVYQTAQYKCEEKEYEILCLKKPGFTHFVPGDGNGHYSWDSLGIRAAQKAYSVDSKRIITIK